MKRLIYIFLAMLSLMLLLPDQSFAGKWKTASFSNQEGARSYRLFVPSGYKKELKSPLLLALHGCMNPPDQFSGLARLESLGEKQKALILMPEQSLLANLNMCWNWHEERNQNRGAGEPSIIMGMVDLILKSYSINPTKVYVFGVSAGGGMTSILLATYPEYFKAGMVASGAMYKAADGLGSGITAASFGSPNSPTETAEFAFNEIKKNKIKAKRIPLLVFHGDFDQTSNPTNSLQTVEQFLELNDLLDDGVANDSVNKEPSVSEQQGIENGYPYSIARYTDAKGKTLVDYIVVRGMGHGWSGGDNMYLFNFPLGPNQTEIMWNFFSSQK